MRYSHTGGLTQKAASARGTHQQLAERLRACLPVTNALAENAISRSLSEHASTVLLHQLFFLTQPRTLTTGESERATGRSVNRCGRPRAGCQREGSAYQRTTCAGELIPRARCGKSRQA